MSLKIFIVFICAAVGTATGYAVMLSYRKKFEYLDGVCSMINALKRNIAYRRDGVASVLNGLDVKSKSLEKNIGEYIAYATGKSSEPKIGKNFLPNDIYEKTCELFLSLGRSDGKTQTDELNMFGESFSALRATAEEKYKKHGAVAVKLGFLVGLLAGVLVL